MASRTGCKGVGPCPWHAADRADDETEQFQHLQFHLLTSQNSTDPKIEWICSLCSGKTLKGYTVLLTLADAGCLLRCHPSFRCQPANCSLQPQCTEAGENMVAADSSQLRRECGCTVKISEGTVSKLIPPPQVIPADPAHKLCQMLIELESIEKTKKLPPDEYKSEDVSTVLFNIIGQVLELCSVLHGGTFAAKQAAPGSPKDDKQGGNSCLSGESFSKCLPVDEVSECLSNVSEVSLELDTVQEKLISQEKVSLKQVKVLSEKGKGEVVLDGTTCKNEAEKSSSVSVGSSNVPGELIASSSQQFGKVRIVEEKCPYALSVFCVEKCNSKGSVPLSLRGSDLPMEEATSVSKQLSVCWDKGSEIPSCVSSEGECVSESSLSVEQTEGACQPVMVKNSAVISELVLNSAKVQKEFVIAQESVPWEQALGEGDENRISVTNELLPKKVPEGKMYKQFTAVKKCKSDLIREVSVPNNQKFCIVNGSTDFPVVKFSENSFQEELSVFNQLVAVFRLGNLTSDSLWKHKLVKEEEQKTLKLAC